MKNYYRVLVVMLSSLSLDVAASYTNEFGYLGASHQTFDYSELDFSPEIDTSQLTTSVYNAGSSSTGTRLYLGYQFNRFIAAEVGFTSFSNARFTVKEESTSTVLQSGKFKTVGADIRAIGTYPFTDNLFLKAHIGALLWDNEFTFLSGTTTDLSTEDDNTTGISLLTGLGLGYGLNDIFAISLDFETTEIADVSTKSLAVSIVARF
jgi:hypothetical protein